MYGEDPLTTTWRPFVTGGIGAGLLLDRGGQGEVPSHPRNAVWGDRECRPRATRLRESYSEGRGRAIAHDVTSAASNFAPADENVTTNLPLAQLLEKDAVLFPEEVDRGLLAPIDPARVRGNRFRVRQGKGRITTLWSSTELLDPTVLEATK